MNETSELDEAIDACHETVQICERTIAHCLQAGGAHAAPDHVGAMQDAAQACSLAASMMSRRSPQYADACGLCAQLAEICASSCARFQDDEASRRCAASSRRTAELCRRMAGGRVAGQDVTAAAAGGP